MADQKSLTSGRARRAIKMGGLASQVGSSYLWDFLRRPFLNTGERERELLDTHVRNAIRIVEGSTQLRGAFMKLVQMLSMREDILPAAALDVLKATQSNVPPMDYPTIAEQIRRELGKPPERLFATFEREAFAAASLGQVHRATLKNGEQVAVKIQYPGVEATVSQDLKNLKMLLRAVQTLASDVMRQKIDTEELFSELKQRLNEELDYLRESRNIATFRRLLNDDPEIEIPRVIPDRCSPRILTMTFLEGYRLTEVMGPAIDPNLRKWLARKYYALVWRQILEFGVLHTDPHPGNYLVTFHPHLGVLDFGSIRRFPDQIRRAHLKFARGLLARDDAQMAAALVVLGYLDGAQDPAPMIRIVRLLFEPALEDREYDPSKYDSVGKAAAVGEIAFENKLYKGPAHGVFLIRALIGLEGIIRQLGSRENYRELFRECVERVKE